MMSLAVVLAFASQSVPPSEEIDFGMLVLRMFLFLGLILLLIYLLLKRVLPHVAKVSGFNNRNIKIVERLPVDAKKSLIVVDVQDKTYLMGCSENSISILMELDRSKMEVKGTQVSPSAITFENVFKKIAFRSKSGGSQQE
ncbi:MAG TPA: flagellar biosynthetic protein FliO [Acidobacteriota bacterium]|jgi:flagellar biosynthetic protein FliO|nr:flagellar biosynthetic protein FliO [Acidobacteriota bacterium]